MTLLELKSISWSRDGKDILKDLSFSLEAGDYLSLVGASGSGKSSLLRIIGSLTSPSSGEILFKDQAYEAYDPLELRSLVHYSFQIPYLFGQTVSDNLSYPFRIRSKDFDRARVLKLLQALNMGEDFLSKSITSLSGGEAQRISLIRSILTEPELLLLDEVTGSLDRENKRLVNDLLRDLNSGGTSIISISHDPSEARLNANRLILIEEGKILREEVLR